MSVCSVFCDIGLRVSIIVSNSPLGSEGGSTTKSFHKVVGTVITFSISSPSTLKVETPGHGSGGGYFIVFSDAPFGPKVMSGF